MLTVRMKQEFQYQFVRCLVKKSIFRRWRSIVVHILDQFRLLLTEIFDRKGQMELIYRSMMFYSQPFM